MIVQYVKVTCQSSTSEVSVPALQRKHPVQCSCGATVHQCSTDSQQEKE